MHSAPVPSPYDDASSSPPSSTTHNASAYGTSAYDASVSYGKQSVCIHNNSTTLNSYENETILLGRKKSSDGVY